MKRFGKCRLCGAEGELSFEHTPPRRAFNKGKVVVATFDQFRGLGPDAFPVGREQQAGMGDYTLCVKCNNDTGSWYGSRFVDWCYQGRDILVKTGGKPSLIYLHYLFPLAIIKQIVVMFFTVNSLGFADKNPELVKFVLNKEKRYLSPKYRVFVYYNIEGGSRSSGIVAKGNLLNGSSSIFSEMNYPPFGYVLTLGSDPPDERLCEITHFSRCAYRDFKVWTMDLPVLPTHLWFPGDYRTKEQIRSDYDKGIKFMKENKIPPSSP
jgi:hypothetical protein